MNLAAASLRAFVALLLCCTGAARAQDFGLERLMQQLAAAPSSKVDYRETRYSKLLAAPVESTGTLLYRRPDLVQKDMATPRVERFRIEGDTLSVTREGKERRVPLSSQPLLAAFAASLRGVLAGDERILRDYFRMALRGTEDAWTLELLPIDEEVSRYVERVSVSGHDARISTIEVRETGGDRSVLQVR